MLGKTVVDGVGGDANGKVGTSFVPMSSVTAAQPGCCDRWTKEPLMATLLWIIAALFVIGGIVTAVRGAVLYGVVLVVVGLLIGPGGVSIFS